MCRNACVPRFARSGRCDQWTPGYLLREELAEIDHIGIFEVPSIRILEARPRALGPGLRQDVGASRFTYGFGGGWDLAGQATPSATLFLSRSPDSGTPS